MEPSTPPSRDTTHQHNNNARFPGACEYVGSNPPVPRLIIVTRHMRTLTGHEEDRDVLRRHTFPQPRTHTKKTCVPCRGASPLVGRKRMGPRSITVIRRMLISTRSAETEPTGTLPVPLLRPARLAPIPPPYDHLPWYSEFAPFQRAVDQDRLSRLAGSATTAPPSTKHLRTPPSQTQALPGSAPFRLAHGHASWRRPAGYMTIAARHTRGKQRQCHLRDTTSSRPLFPQASRGCRLSGPGPPWWTTATWTPYGRNCQPFPPGSWGSSVSP